mmetsp:Transcript_47206/g.137308  ORF Transcript_47206/g.137308 Transcript_47206/m.137308 type:complete len:400 (-) Transcript_47206:106-1305(-)
MRFFKSSTCAKRNKDINPKRTLPIVTSEDSAGIVSPRTTGLQSTDRIGWVARPISQADLQNVANEIGQKVQEWDATRFALVKKLQEAERNQGDVVLMEDTSKNKTSVAVKRMPTKWACHTPEEFEQKNPLSSEKPWYDIAYLKQLDQLDYPYTARLHAVYRSDTQTFFVTSFCDSGDLFSWCGHPSVPPPGGDREVIMRPLVGQLVSAVRWLHDLGIAHRDISLENTLLDGGVGRDAKVKLIDFGMATTSRTAKNEITGKPSYQAPEIHDPDTPVDCFVADNFSVGVTIFAMSVQDYPWTCTKIGKCQLFMYVSNFGFRKFLSKRKLRTGRGETLDEILSPDFADVVEGLVNFDPVRRASLGEACFSTDVSERRRKDVWGMRYLKLVEGKVPSPSNLLA